MLTITSMWEFNQATTFDKAKLTQFIISCPRNSFISGVSNQHSYFYFISPFFWDCFFGRLKSSLSSSCKPHPSKVDSAINAESGFMSQTTWKILKIRCKWLDHHGTNSILFLPQIPKCGGYINLCVWEVFYSLLSCMAGMWKYWLFCLEWVMWILWSLSHCEDSFVSYYKSGWSLAWIHPPWGNRCDRRRSIRRMRQVERKVGEVDMWHW